MPSLDPKISTEIEMSAVPEPDLKQPDLYINRELSLLEFNRRVLEQAKDSATPLLERLRFLCISSTNLDEFFEIRVAGLKQKAALGSVHAGPDNMTPQDVLNVVAAKAHSLVAEQYRVLNELLIPELAAQNIHFIRRGDWTDEESKWMQEYFQQEVFPLLSPIGLDPAHPFPRILNKSLNFIVALQGKDAFGRNSGMAVIQAPRALPRIIRIPGDIAKVGYRFVFLSSIIHSYVNELFPGMTVKGCYQFRATRNSELFVDAEEVDDLLIAMEGELAARRYGDTVRVEMADNCPEDLALYLQGRFRLQPEDLYMVDGPVNINRLLSVADLVDRPDLVYPSFTPGIPPKLENAGSIFEVLRKQNILLHHPYESFLPVVEFVRQAARDPKVLAIKQTLYRTDSGSVIVDALVDAAKKGKEVTVVIELRARFDEEANINLATRLQEAGAHVVYGVVGFKTHAKMILVIRREGKRLRNYVHLGTGNYHSRTARVYTDYGLMSSDEVLGEDVHKVFWQLTSLGRFSESKKMLQSPFTLHKTLLSYVDREIKYQQQGGNGHIIVKVNALVEPQIIQSLYRASMAGVKIDLIVRGMCAVRPGVPGISENITVRSIIGRFLEHPRVYYFHNNGDPHVFCASADWIERNFFRRVEVAFPVEPKKLRDRIISDLELNLRDNCQAWILGRDGVYTRLTPALEAEAVSAQGTLLLRNAG